MKLTRKKSLLLLAVTALICSRGFFALVDDPEGPNLLIVSVLAGIIYTVSIAPFMPRLNILDIKSVLLSLCIQVILVISVYIFLI